MMYSFSFGKESFLCPLEALDDRRGNMKHWKIWITAAFRRNRKRISRRPAVVVGKPGRWPGSVTECQNHRRCITGTTWRNPERNQAHAYR